jgi:hypothetical protein
MPARAKRDADLEKFQFWWTVLLLGCVVFVGGLVMGLRAWRFSHFPHSVATIQEVWEQKIKRSRRGDFIMDRFIEPTYDTFTFGQIEFERSQKGEKYVCTQSVRLGKPEDKYQVGEKLDVVPATGTCQRVDVIGRLK